MRKPNGFALSLAAFLAATSLPIVSSASYADLIFDLNPSADLAQSTHAPTLSVLQAEPQKMDRQSALSSNVGGPVRSTEFAKLIGDLLTKDGKSNVRDAQFLFQQCYSGGFLKDLEGTLTVNGVKWVAGTATSSTRVAFGQDSLAEIKRWQNLTAEERALLSDAKPHDYWTKALLPELDKDQTALEAIKKAHDADKLGTGKGADPKLLELINKALGRKPGKELPPEDGQTASGNGGDTITLKDAAAEKHYAILWAGAANRSRDSNDRKGIEDVLKSQWGDPKTDPSVKIFTVFNLKELQKVIEEIKKTIGPKDQFFFYSSDHGERVADQPKPKQVRANSIDLESFVLSTDELDAMLVTPDNVPLLSLAYDKVPIFLPVSLNGKILGSLDPSESEVMFSVSELDLGFDNSIEIFNLSDASFILDAKSFTSGAMPTMLPTVIPEPGSMALMSIGVVVLIAASRKRPAVAKIAASASATHEQVAWRDPCAIPISV